MIKGYFDSIDQGSAAKRLIRIVAAITRPLPGGLAVATASPQARFVDQIEEDTYARRANRIRIQHRHERIVAIKVANGSVGYVSELIQRCDLAILSGDDPLTLPMQSVGAIGAVSVAGNVVPGEVVRQVASANRGDFAAARAIHRAEFPLRRASRPRARDRVSRANTH